MAKKYAIIGALDKAMETEGLKFTFLLRLCPLVPFNAFNYMSHNLTIDTNILFSYSISVDVIHLFLIHCTNKKKCFHVNKR